MRSGLAGEYRVGRRSGHGPAQSDSDFALTKETTVSGSRIVAWGTREFRAITARWVGKALGLSAVSVAVLLAAKSRSSGQGQVPPDDRIRRAPRSAAVALARLVPANGLISVGARPGIRIDEIKVKEGDQVSQGAVLALLEGHATAQHQLDLAKAKKTLDDRQQRARLAAARKAAEDLQDPPG